MEKEIFPKVLIENTGKLTRVLIDGEEVKGVTKVQFTHDPNTGDPFPRLCIELMASQVTLNTMQIPALPEIFAPFYVPLQKLVDAGKITEEEIEGL